MWLTFGMMSWCVCVSHRSHPNMGWWKNSTLRVHRVGKRILLPFLPLRHLCIFVIFAFSSFLHFYTSAGQTCIAVVSKSKIDEEKLSSGTNDDYPDLSNHARIGTLRYCHHHKPLLYSKNFAKLFSTQRHASSCGDVLGLCEMAQCWFRLNVPA